MARRGLRKTRRAVLIVAFLFSVLILLSYLLSHYFHAAPSQLSAYDDDWNDLSAFRDELNDMGITTRSLVSSPLLLDEVDDPAHTVFIVTGVERDTYSLPQFGDPAGGLVSLKQDKGYSHTEVEAILAFIAAGGSVLVLDDFGYGQSLGEDLGITYSGHRLYDEVYAGELDANYTWMNVSEEFTWSGDEGMESHAGHERWFAKHPCSIWAREWGEATLNADEAGLCAHRLNATNNQVEYDPSFSLLMNTPSAFEAYSSKLAFMQAVGSSSPESYLDLNDDGYILLEAESELTTPDIQGPFPMYIEACVSPDCGNADEGRVFFVSDGSMLINVIYDDEGARLGTYGDSVVIPQNDNRVWALDFIAESLITNTTELSSTHNSTPPRELLQPPEGSLVIFDESRHKQSNLVADSYNIIYYMLVYFTSDGTAMLLMFLGLFITMEAVIIKKTDPEQWQHTFSIIYYGFGESSRYPYYGKTNKVKQIYLSRVRNANGLSREEFDSLPARELQGMINDPVLVKFVFEDRDYSLEQLVSIVKRVKAWGRK